MGLILVRNGGGAGGWVAGALAMGSFAWLVVVLRLIEEVLLRGYVVDDDGGGWSGVFSVPDDGSGKLFGGPKS